MTLWDAAFQSISEILTTVMLAALVLFFGLVLGKIIGRLVYYLAKEFGADSLLQWGFGFDLPLAHLISTIVTFAIYILSVIFALSILKLASLVSTIVAGVVGLIILIYMFLGLKDVLSNILASLVIWQRKEIVPGVTLTAQNMTGMVESSTLQDTRIVLSSGDLVSIPNTLLVSQPYVVKKKSTRKK